MPHAPQLFRSVERSAQVPPQRIWPVGQAQTPAVQSCPPVQARPHTPQLALVARLLSQPLASLASQSP